MLSAIIPREPGNPAHNHKLQRPASVPWRLRHTFCAPKLTKVASQPVHNEQRACITMHAIHSSTLQFSVYKWLGSLFYVYGITPHYILSIWEYGKWYTMKQLYMFATGHELKLPSQTKCAVCQIEFAVSVVQWYWYEVPLSQVIFTMQLRFMPYQNHAAFAFTLNLL